MNRNQATRGIASAIVVLVVGLTLQHGSPGSTRDVIVDGIGRGLGRVAAHEFTRQLLHSVNLDTREDIRSYELHSTKRATLFYQPIRRAFAGVLLLKRIRPSL